MYEQVLAKFNKNASSCMNIYNNKIAIKKLTGIQLITTYIAMKAISYLIINFCGVQYLININKPMIRPINLISHVGDKSDSHSQSNFPRNIRP